MDMNNSEIRFFRFLSEKLNLNEDDAETFVALQKEVQADSLTTKGDLADLRTALKGDIAELRTELKGGISELKNEMVLQESRLENKITQSSASLKVSMERYRSNVLWAVVLFWLAQVGVFLGFAYRLFPGL